MDKSDISLAYYFEGNVNKRQKRTTGNKKEVSYKVIEVFDKIKSPGKKKLDAEKIKKDKDEQNKKKEDEKKNTKKTVTDKKSETSVNQFIVLPSDKYTDKYYMLDTTTTESPYKSDTQKSNKAYNLISGNSRHLDYTKHSRGVTSSEYVKSGKLVSYIPINYQQISNETKVRLLMYMLALNITYASFMWIIFGSLHIFKENGYYY